jgi:hypothetical protein
MNEEGEPIGRAFGDDHTFEISGVPRQPVSFAVAAANQFGTGPSADVDVPADPLPVTQTPRASAQEPAAAALLGLSISRKRFVAALRGPSILPLRRQQRFGTGIGFRLSAAAGVTFGVLRKKREIGRFSADGWEGKNRVRFSGRVDGQRLRAGSYFLVAHLGDGISASRRIRFEVLPTP